MDHTITTSLLGIPSHELVSLMDVFAALLHDCERPKQWLLQALFDEIARRENESEEGGLLEIPLFDWTSLELVNFTKTIHVVTFGPISERTAVFIDELNKYLIAAVFCRLLKFEKEAAQCCY